jgi:hypothetical protein
LISADAKRTAAEAPSTKLQAPEKFQTANSKSVRIWNLRQSTGHSVQSRASSQERFDVSDHSKHHGFRKRCEKLLPEPPVVGNFFGQLA